MVRECKGREKMQKHQQFIALAARNETKNPFFPDIANYLMKNEEVSLKIHIFATNNVLY